MHIKHFIIICTLVSAITLSSPSSYADNVKTVNWKTDTINWSQISDLLSKNIGVDQFAIKFPNQTTWNVAPAQLQQIHSTYLQKAQTMGINTNQLPELSFSSALKAGSNSLFGSLPIQSVMNNPQLQQSIGMLLDKSKLKHYEPINLGNSFPDWLNQLVNTVYIGILNLCEYIHQMFLGIGSKGKNA